MGKPGARAVDKRMRFVTGVEVSEETVTALCRRFGFSRKTGYKWLERYRSEGIEGLSDRSRAPREHRHAVTAALAERCLLVRRTHPTWGPVKVRAWLNRHDGAAAWPAASTIGVLFDPRRVDGAAQAAAARGAVERAVRGVRRCQRGVVHRLQGLVPDRRRYALRTADLERRAHSLSAALPGARPQRYRARLAGARCGVPGIRAAAAAALG